MNARCIRDDWGSKSRWGDRRSGGYGDSHGTSRGSSWGGDRGGGDRGGNSRWKEGGDTGINFAALSPKDDRLEQELFGQDHTGINFSKYEDIPVEATGDAIPPHINSVSTSLPITYSNS